MNKDHGLPLVSVVTPSFNSAATIAETIESVLRQDYPRVEHIVVDGGSTDGTLDILQHYSHLRWISESDRGQSDAINKGFGMAQGDILAWLNADDLYHLGAISTAVTWLMRNPDVGLVHSDLEVIDADGRNLHIDHALDFEPDQIFLHNEIPGQCTTFWHRRVTDQVGFLDADLHFAMDYDLWLRIAMCYPIRRIPGRCLASFRLWPASKTGSMPAAWPPEQDRILERALNNPAFAALQDPLRARSLASGLRHRAALACYRADLDQAADYFWQASRTWPTLRDRDIQVLTWKIGNCKASPYVPDAIELLERFFRIRLPDEIANLKRVFTGNVHLQYALENFDNGYMRLSRKHLLWAFRYQPSFLSNRGLRSIFVQTVLGKGAPARLRTWPRQRGRLTATMTDEKAS